MRESSTRAMRADNLFNLNAPFFIICYDFDKISLLIGYGATLSPFSTVHFLGIITSPPFIHSSDD